MRTKEVALLQSVQRFQNTYRKDSRKRECRFVWQTWTWWEAHKDWEIFWRGMREGKLARLDCGHSVHQIEVWQCTNKKQTFEIGVSLEKIHPRASGKMSRKSDRCDYSRCAHDLAAGANTLICISLTNQRFPPSRVSPSYYFLRRKSLREALSNSTPAFKSRQIIRRILVV